MTTDPFIEAARAEAERRWSRGLLDGGPLPGHRRMDRRIGFDLGAQWTRDRFAQEPSEDDAYAAHLERRRHRLSYVKPGVIRCSCGAPGYWGSAAGQEQHAMWHALRAGRAALAESGEDR